MLDFLNDNPFLINEAEERKTATQHFTDKINSAKTEEELSVVSGEINKYIEKIGDIKKRKRFKADMNELTTEKSTALKMKSGKVSPSIKNELPKSSSILDQFKEKMNSVKNKEELDNLIDLFRSRLQDKKSDSEELDKLMSVYDEKLKSLKAQSIEDKPVEDENMKKLKNIHAIKTSESLSKAAKEDIDSDNDDTLTTKLSIINSAFKHSNLSQKQLDFLDNNKNDEFKQIIKTNNVSMMRMLRELIQNKINEKIGKSGIKDTDSDHETIKNIVRIVKNDETKESEIEDLKKENGKYSDFIKFVNNNKVRLGTLNASKIYDKFLRSKTEKSVKDVSKKDQEYDNEEQFHNIKNAVDFAKIYNSLNSNEIDSKKEEPTIHLDRTDDATVNSVVKNIARILANEYKRKKLTVIDPAKVLSGIYKNSEEYFGGKSSSEHEKRLSKLYIDFVKNALKKKFGTDIPNEKQWNDEKINFSDEENGGQREKDLAFTGSKDSPKTIKKNEEKIKENISTVDSKLKALKKIRNDISENNGDIDNSKAELARIVQLMAADYRTFASSMKKEVGVANSLETAITGKINKKMVDSGLSRDEAKKEVNSDIIKLLSMKNKTPEAEFSSLALKTGYPKDAFDMLQMVYNSNRENSDIIGKWQKELRKIKEEEKNATDDANIASDLTSATKKGETTNKGKDTERTTEINSIGKMDKKQAMAVVNFFILSFRALIEANNEIFSIRSGVKDYKDATRSKEEMPTRELKLSDYNKLKQEIHSTFGSSKKEEKTAKPELVKKEKLNDSTEYKSKIMRLING